MDTKQMVVADLNVVFGKEEEPLLKRLDEIVMPALKSGIIRDASEDVKYFFEDCEVTQYNNEWVIKGILIKDMVLSVVSEYTEDKLLKTNKRFPSSPYSVFLIYLKNHRMTLVKNQGESPDIRSFKVSLQYILKEFISQENEKRKLRKEELLPHSRVYVSGIKTSQSVKESLKDVEQITELTFQLNPLNAEWDYDPIFGGIDSAIRQVIGSKKGRMIFPSPASKDGVANVIEKTEGLVKAKMKVRYKDDTEKGDSQKKGVIKDSEISNVSTISISKELDDAIDEIYKYKASFPSLNVISENNLKLYREYLSKKGK